MAIQCLSKLREKLPVVLSLSDFFENPTVAQQAAFVKPRLRPLHRNGNSVEPAASQTAAAAVDRGAGGSATDCAAREKPALSA